ncbi:MAG: family 20 glycosylhydrolase, partial [Phycisphaerales bacterium]|nr:family 20 glycosylhydrolase [Phycisphaerales bacterium]
MNLTRKLLTLGLVLVANALAQAAGPALIPQPLTMTTGEGTFTIDAQTVIVMEDSLVEKNNLRHAVSCLLAVQLRKSTGFPLTVKSIKPGEAAPKNAIAIRQAANKVQGDEGYSFVSTADGVTISANARGGAFYGTQTLMQLLPAEAISSKTAAKDVVMSIPCVTIEDKPRFSWRAYMLDEGRNFKGKAEVLQLLDQMAILKMNVFHWHLVDDQGWRLEIKKYPKLTSIGSKRTDTHLGGWKSAQRHGKPHSGFYTQDDIREIVKYAADRHIEIVPEVELPAHTLSAVVAYPHLCCTGKQMVIPTRHSISRELYCAGRDSTWEFLENVMTEVCELFPGKYIHIGGDEARYDRWKACSHCQKKLKELGLKSEKELQGWMTRRIEKF